VDPEVSVELLTDIYLLVIRDGLSIEAAVEKDGRISKRTYYYWQTQMPAVCDQAQRAAKEIVEAGRQAVTDDLVTRQAEKLRKTQDILLDEVEATIESVIKIRDTAHSDFVKLQAAQTIMLWHERFNSPALPTEERPALPAPRQSGGLLGLIGKGMPTGASLRAKAPDGTTVEISGPKAAEVVDN